MSKKVEAKEFEIVKTISTGRHRRTETAQVVARINGRRVTRHVRKDNGVWKDLQGNTYS
ncbi:MAG: hypothetical protein R3346_00595 [Candidatus Spechtbacterales bacterium]|nr:hypothetical protein [Candidatus Spechtbacterales bacterium]